METIIVHARFHAAHRQIGYPGKCRWVHGHTWEGTVTIATEAFPRDELDMSIDFGDIKDVMRFLDHKVLVTGQDSTLLDAALFEPAGVVLLKGKGPSVENVAAYIFDGVAGLIQTKYPGRSIRYTIEVRIQETDHNIFVIQKPVVV